MKKYKLQDPIEKEDGNQKILIDTIEIDKLRAKYFKLIPKEVYAGKEVSPDKFIKLISGMTSLNEDIVGEIEINDFMKLVNTVVESLGEQVSPQTGTS